VQVLNQPAHRPARAAWLTFLRRRQLTEDLGWTPSDKPYGGWGYCAVLPRKPKAGAGGPPMLESNLSATLFALEALRAAGTPADDPAFARALVFLRRCQNFADDPAPRDAAFDDGGFFFIYDDSVRNKAGTAGKDSAGRERFHSYGSATADGLRGLLLCGLPPTDARVQAARSWLERHFNVASHPGTYAANREGDRASVYFYYCGSLALALWTLNMEEIQTPSGKVRWARVLVDELLQRQKDDGSWINPAVAQRENDPLVATAEAMAALAVCRTALAR
jgi:squalene-hopene/tetraprenyl-beta-curcumene cyclase